MIDTKKEQERDELHRAIWAIADELRGAVDGWDFKNYVLGTMFYRYISENLTAYVNSGEIEAGNTEFDYAKMSDAEAEEAREGLVEEKGFFILPSELFCNVRVKAASDENLNETLERVFRNIEESAKGSQSEGSFAGLFDGFDVNSNKLGSTVAKRNERLVKLLDGVGAMNLGSVKGHDINALKKNKAVTKNIRVAAYCRVSTDQDDQLLSLETQKAHYESWIQGHPNWEYAGLYYDEGLSGTKMDNRPSLLKMVEDCKHGLIDYVVTKSVSRLARNTADFLTIVRGLLDLGIPIYFERENIDTGSMENELMLSIMSSIAESESVSISENNKWSIQRKFKNGTYKCSYPPYGYDWDKKKSEMVVNHEQAEIVRYIFAQTLAEVGIHDIAKDLVAKGILTKKGGKWTGHTVNGIVRNEKYTGDCLFQKTYTDSSFVRRRNLGEMDQYYVEDHHEAIISREDYEAANDVIDRRRQEKGIELDNGKYQNRYPLSGKAICGECGGTFKRKTYTHKVVLACTQHIDDKEKCSMKYVYLEAVEVAFATMMNRLVYGRNKVLRPFYEALQQSN